uniref:Glycosyl hydrolase-like 10 domain-containing protein n=1 Tax=Planktothricoides sp. SpSt-374 TaxID=2282167 RepID=A0A7C3VFI0_9CYAN
MAMLTRRLAVSAAIAAATFSPLMASLPAIGTGAATCLVPEAARAEKNQLREAALKGDAAAQQRYQQLIASEAKRLQECRSKNWPQTQAIWLRLYPCDAQPGALEAVLDRIVDKGYNEVYVEVFYDGQVLLPAASNPTPWPSVLRNPGQENIDLLAEVLPKGRQRGLKMYAWMFTMNFGYNYSQRADRQEALARNSQGKTTLNVTEESGVHDTGGSSSHTFIDPYSPIARRDYATILNAILQRKPDGVLFDYVRYHRGIGAASVVGDVKDLWIYGEASKQTLYQRGLNEKGRELIRRFVNTGFITAQDIEAIDKLYPTEAEPLWQGRRPGSTPVATSASQRQPLLQWELWYLSVAHAVQGVLDFVSLASDRVQKEGIPSGAVFFPGGNRPVGQWGYDSRLQAWDRFGEDMEWHPMSYANCGNPRCIMEEVQRVIDMAAPETKIVPALAGYWGSSTAERPSLESQMEALRGFAPRINAVSHFAYSWQEPESDKQRKFCQSQ